MKRLAPSIELIEEIKKRYPTEATKALAKSLGLRVSQLYKIALSRGIKKDAGYLKEHVYNITDYAQESVKYHFPKGHVPVNKGKKMDPTTKAKVKHTFFALGHEPHNTRKDGDISIRADKSGKKYMYIRLAKSKWELLQRVVWKKVHGEIPAGSVVIFKDGNTLNCVIENLEIISRQQNMERNRISSYPVELQQLVRLKNKLNKSIIKKQSNHGAK